MTAPENVPEGAVAIPVGRYFALVDEADYALVSPYRWCPSFTPSGKLYAHAWVAAEGRPVFMHRLVDGTPDGFDTDHRNGNCLDNRRRNLRPATKAENMANSGKMRRRDGRPPHSEFKGVTRSKGKWRAQIQVHGVRKFLGDFTSEIEAALAYDRAAATAWPKFVRLNFPDGVPVEFLEAAS